MRVMVLGGTGFVGRHAAAALRARGHAVVIGTRHPKRALREAAARPAGLRAARDPLRVPHHALHLEAAAAGRRRGGQRGRHPARARRRDLRSRAQHGARRAGRGLRAPRPAPGSRLRARVAARGAEPLSALQAGRGARRSPQSGADYSIVRPALLDGEGGFGAGMAETRRGLADPFLSGGCRRAASRRWTCATWARRSPCFASAAAKAGAKWSWAAARGARWRSTWPRCARDHDRRPALRLPVPALLARLGGHLCDLLHFSPFSHGHLELMRRDNLPHANLLQRADRPRAGARRPRAARRPPAYPQGVKTV